MHVPPGYAMFIPSAIRKAVELPVVGVGRFKDPLQAERALAEGHCDLVGVVRGQIADAEFAAKARAGATEEIRLCLSCNQECVGRMGLNRWLGCIENPRTGREARRRDRSDPAGRRRRRRVLVVGAGPGGLQAAIAAARAGHDVTVLEREAEPGGQVRLAASVPNRAELGDMIRNQVTECRRLGVTIEYGVDADVDIVRARRPDDVVVATGAAASRPWWVGPDVANACDVRDVLTGAATPDRRRRADRRDRVPPRHVGGRAARRPGLPGRGGRRRGWSSARTSASPSTWSSGGSGPTPRASCSRPTSCRWASTAPRSRCCTTRRASTRSARRTGSCSPSRPTRPSSSTSTCAPPGVAAERVGDCVAPRRAHAAVVEGERAGAQRSADGPADADRPR